MLRHCPAGLDADLAEYLARKQIPVLNSTDNSPSDGAECGDSASGEDEFNEGYLDSVNKNTITTKNGCAVLEAGVGGHIAGFTTAMVIV